MIKTLKQNLRLPSSFRKKIVSHENINTLNILRKLKLNTVCEEARCPNISECFSNNIATFMILGDICTRKCKYCSVKTGKPEKVNEMEHISIINAINELKLDYVVITSVNRDELLDYGAKYFSSCIEKIKKQLPNVIIEILTPDFQGNKKSISKIINTKPNVFAHNIETVKELFSTIKPQSKWTNTSSLLKQISNNSKNIITKSGIMVGLGENDIQVEDTLKYLCDIGIQVVTIGQYLRPTLKHWPVNRYVTQKSYDNWINLGEKIGFKKIFAGPFVRSSYNAKNIFKYLKIIS